MNDIPQLTELMYAVDTFYFLICGVLVMWMAAGFSMLEAGMVRSKNTAEILTKNIALFAIACTMYLILGYYLMYSSSAGGFLPNLGFLIGGENTVDAITAGGEDAPYYSMRSDFFFQVVFVATAMSIVSGAVAERMKLWAFLAFAVVMTGVIYPVSGYWTWGGGWLAEAGYSDYAGSGIAHLAGATAALAGLVAITADPLSPGAVGASLIGAVGGLIVVAAIVTLDKLKIDDPVGAISVHGVVGIWGVLVVPLSNGDASFGAQIIGILGIFAWVFAASLVVWLILKAIMGIRVSEEEEYEGVDLAECGLEAYPEFSAPKK